MGKQCREVASPSPNSVEKGSRKTTTHNSSEPRELTMKIFVADDSATLRERMIRLLSGLSGIEVVGQAQDALAAFGAICEAKPDIVTLDIELIGGSGIDV